MSIKALFIAVAQQVESAWEQIPAAEEASPRRRPRFIAHCLQNLRSVMLFRRCLENRGISLERSA